MWTAFLFAPDDYHIRRFQMEQNDKTKEGQQENKRDVRKLLDDSLERLRRRAKEEGFEVRINEKKGPIVIFNPPRYLIEQAKKAREMEKRSDHGL